MSASGYIENPNCCTFSIIWNDIYLNISKYIIQTCGIHICYQNYCYGTQIYVSNMVDGSDLENTWFYVRNIIKGLDFQKHDTYQWKCIALNLEISNHMWCLSLKWSQSSMSLFLMMAVEAFSEIKSAILFSFIGNKMSCNT